MTERPFKILSIDGGGIKGLYSATVLDGIEKANGSIVNHFDMICGTSTGGIIALALAAGIPAKDIKQFYTSKGSKIFPCRNMLTRRLAFIKSLFASAKYSSNPLKECLEEVFQDIRIRDLKPIVLIPTVNLTTGEAVVIKSNHQPHLTRDDDHRLVEVALATCSAPTFFPLATMETMKGQLIDGGIWSNNPALLGVIEALKYYVGNGKKYDSLKLLSVSSINNCNGWNEKRFKSLSAARWVNKLVPITMDTQAKAVNNYINHLIDCIPGDFYRIESPVLSSKQSKVIEMDRADNKAIETILALGEEEAHRCNTLPKINEFFKEAV